MNQAARGPAEISSHARGQGLDAIGRGLAAIVVTHDLAVARLLSHRVMVMKGGRVIETGLTDLLLDDPCENWDDFDRERNSIRQRQDRSG